MAFENINKRTLVVGVVAVLVIVVAVVFLSGNYISGGSISFVPVPTDFAVMADTPEGWTTCENGQEGITWELVDNFCKVKGYSGAVPKEYNPCLHEWASTRYYWDGGMPMTQGNSIRTAGFALTKIKCIPA